MLPILPFYFFTQHIGLNCIVQLKRYNIENHYHTSHNVSYTNPRNITLPSRPICHYYDGVNPGWCYRSCIVFLHLDVYISSEPDPLWLYDCRKRFHRLLLVSNCSPLEFCGKGKSLQLSLKHTCSSMRTFSIHHGTYRLLPRHNYTIRVPMTSRCISS